MVSKGSRYLPRKHFHNVMMNPHFTHDSYTDSLESKLEKKIENTFRKAIYPLKLLFVFFTMPIKSLIGKIRSYF